MTRPNIADARRINVSIDSDRMYGITKLDNDAMIIAGPSRSALPETRAVDLSTNTIVNTCSLMLGCILCGDAW